MQALLKRYPLTFRGLRSGIECREGWYPLIDRAAKQTEARLQKLPTEGKELPTSLQVKEKMGVLCWYWNQHDDTTLKTITQEAVKRSISTCEQCGRDV